MVNSTRHSKFPPHPYPLPRFRGRGRGEGGRNMKFVGVREFKQDAVEYLNEGNEIVVMKRKKPIGLSDFAFYSGVGAKATMNLGMVRRI